MRLPTFVQPLALLLVFLAAGCAREKDLLDEQVRKLCAVDGGVKVYERVSLEATRFDEYGNFRVPPRDLAKPEDEYFYDWDKLYFREGNPSMWRSHFKLVRRSDNKLLGEAIVYSRRGGDMPGPWHDSSFGCPENADITAVNRAVFAKEAKTK